MKYFVPAPFGTFYVETATYPKDFVQNKGAWNEARLQIMAGVKNPVTKFDRVVDTWNRWEFDYLGYRFRTISTRPINSLTTEVVGVERIGRYVVDDEGKDIYIPMEMTIEQKRLQDQHEQELGWGNW